MHHIHLLRPKTKRLMDEKHLHSDVSVNSVHTQLMLDRASAQSDNSETCHQ